MCTTDGGSNSETEGRTKTCQARRAVPAQLQPLEPNNHGCAQPRTVANKSSPLLSEVLKTNTTGSEALNVRTHAIGLYWQQRLQYDRTRAVDRAHYLRASVSVETIVNGGNGGSSIFSERFSTPFSHGNSSAVGRFGGSTQLPSRSEPPPSTGHSPPLPSSCSNEKTQNPSDIR
jgi:hypothetical protein